MTPPVPGARTLITAAPTGVESAKADVPALPVSVEEVVAAARSCQAVGAAVVHLHVRDTDTRPTLDLGRVREVVTAAREDTDLVVHLSTGGAVTDPFDARLAEPGAASLTLGTVDSGRDVSADPWGVTVAATGVGRTSLPVMLAALSVGGHLRVGMEDTLTYAPGEPVRDDTQLVARAAGSARIAQRPPMSTADARSMPGIPHLEAAP